MLSMHGAVWVQWRSHGIVEQRARRYAQWLAVVTLAAFALAGVWLSLGIDGYRIVSQPALDALPNPLAKEVEVAAGAWLNNYRLYPLTLLAPISGCIGLIGVFLMAGRGRTGWSFLFSALALAGIIATAGVSMFPFILPSSLSPNSSLTLWDATSSPLTLSVMTVAAIIFVPIVLAYTLWCYRSLWAKISVEYIQDNDYSSY
jgi:cytochrome d ubiquinol oxidase subunit II